VKIVAFNKQYRITLPKDLVEDKGWQAGTELRFIEDEHGRIFLKQIDKRGRVVERPDVQRSGKRGGGGSR